MPPDKIATYPHSMKSLAQCGAFVVSGGTKIKKKSKKIQTNIAKKHLKKNKTGKKMKKKEAANEMSQQFDGVMPGMKGVDAVSFALGLQYGELTEKYPALAMTMEALMELPEWKPALERAVSRTLEANAYQFECVFHSAATDRAKDATAQALYRVADAAAQLLSPFDEPCVQQLPEDDPDFRLGELCHEANMLRERALDGLEPAYPPESVTPPPRPPVI